MTVSRQSDAPSFQRGHHHLPESLAAAVISATAAVVSTAVVTAIISAATEKDKNKDNDPAAVTATKVEA